MQTRPSTLSFTYNIQHGSRFHLTRALTSLPVLRHHFPKSQTIRTLVISHHLASLEDGLFTSEDKPWSLLGLSLQETSLPIVVHRVNDFSSDTALGGMVTSLKMGLVSKAQGAELLVALKVDRIERKH